MVISVKMVVRNLGLVVTTGRHVGLSMERFIIPGAGTSSPAISPEFTAVKVKYNKLVDILGGGITKMVEYSRLCLIFRDTNVDGDG